VRPSIPGSETWQWATVPPQVYARAAAEEIHQAAQQAGELAFAYFLDLAAPPVPGRGRVGDWLVDGSLIQDGSVRLQEAQLHQSWHQVVRVFVRPPWFAVCGWARRELALASTRPIEERGAEPGWHLVDGWFLTPWGEALRQEFCGHGVVAGERCFTCEPMRPHLFPPQLPSQNKRSPRAPGGLV